MNDRLLWFVPTIALAIGMIGLGMVQAERPASGQQTPAEFGLPTYPGSFGFLSSTADPRSKSIAFKVRQGSPQQVADYYRAEMRKRDYLVKQDQALQFPIPGAREGEILRKAPGRQLIFAHPKKAEAVVLWAVEQPFHDAPTQVALGFGPVSQLLGQITVPPK